MRYISFITALVLSITFVTTFSLRTIHTSLPIQILNRYTPDSTGQVVFLGSSLTDAGVNARLLDSLFFKSSINLKAYNLALAEISNDIYSYLICKNWIFAKGKPRIIVIEIRDIPFQYCKKPIRPVINGKRWDLIAPELMTYDDYRFVCGGFPGLLNSIEFFFHKHSYFYHNRMHLQEVIAEKIGIRFKNLIKEKENPYAMHKDAFEIMRDRSRESIRDTASIKSPDFLNGSHFFADLVYLAEKNGTKLLFIRPPYPPCDMELRKNSYFMCADSAFRSICDSLGLSYWDFGSAQSEKQWNFSDRIHLSEESALLFTEKIFEKLQQIDLSN